MKVILLAGFGFDPLLNDNFSLQDQCIIQRKNGENWKRISPTPKVSFFDERQNFPAQLKGSVGEIGVFQGLIFVVLSSPCWKKNLPF